MDFKTEQEAFWHGRFGDEYVERNRGGDAMAANIALFARILGCRSGIASALELGANIGLNLVALRQLLPACALSAVEINDKAVAEARRSIPSATIFHRSLLDFAPDRQWDLVFTKGVLIHIDPNSLPAVYALLHRASARYVLVAEYYNPVPAEIGYRGHSGKLFKRDFAGELLDLFPDLALIDYGFAYHRDPVFRQDDLNWFLMEKR